MTCESLSAFLDDAIIKWHEAEDSYLIVISRQGRGERSQGLGRARLGNVEQYLKRYKVKYRTAVGSNVEGPGRIEIYVAGKLTNIVQVRKNRRSACEGNVNPFIGS